MTNPKTPRGAEFTHDQIAAIYAAVEDFKFWSSTIDSRAAPEVLRSLAIEIVDKGFALRRTIEAVFREANRTLGGPPPLSRPGEIIGFGPRAKLEVETKPLAAIRTLSGLGLSLDDFRRAAEDLAKHQKEST